MGFLDRLTRRRAASQHLRRLPGHLRRDIGLTDFGTAATDRGGPGDPRR